MGRPGLVPLLQPGFLGPRTPSVLREIFFLILINIIIYIHNKYKNIFRFYIFRLLGPRTPSVLHEKKRVSKNDHSCHELLSKKLKKKNHYKISVKEWNSWPPNYLRPVQEETHVKVCKRTFFFRIKPNLDCDYPFSQSIFGLIHKVWSKFDFGDRPKLISIILGVTC